MRTKLSVFSRLVVFMGFLGLLAVGVGCPDSDPLDPGNGQLVVAVQGVNATGTRYDRITVSVQQIQLRPVDPVADAALGPNALGVFTFPVQIDLTQGRTDIPTAFLAPGLYRVISLRLQSSLTLFDDDPVVPPATCIEGVIDPGADNVFGTADDTSTIVDPRFGVRGFPSTGFGFTFQDEGFVNIDSEGGTLVVNFDVPTLAAAWESSVNCATAVNQLCNNARTLSCLSNFNSTTFTTLARPAISFD